MPNAVISIRVFVLPEIRRINQVLPGSSWSRSRIDSSRGIAQAVLRNMQGHRLDMGRIETTVFDRRLP
jgi:hypothetical protein